MKKMIFSFGAVIMLASFTSHPAKKASSTTETLKVEVRNGKFYTAHMTGMQEPGGGDPNGYGYANVSLNIGQGTITYDMEVYNIETATAAHIHYGAAGVVGPAVVELHAPHTGATAGVAQVDKELIKMISKNPQNYYINVHNAAYPNGAIRGQLTK